MHIRLMSMVTAAALLLTTTATLAQKAPDNLERSVSPLPARPAM